MIVDSIEYLKKKIQTLKVLGIICIAIILVFATVGVDLSHAHTGLEAHIPGFWALFTLIACLVLIYFARWFGKSGIQTREDYYGD